MRLLVTGGAGYIGGVVAAQLVDAGHQVTILDDLSTGHRAAITALPATVTFVEGTLRDDAERVLRDGYDGVLHFAAKSLVGESMAHPARYFSGNLGGSLALLDAMRVTGVRRIVFSSTAACYGDPDRVPIEEDDPTRPINPYGASKVAVDTAIAEYARLHGIGGTSLRYFNVAGARTTGDPATWLGERHDPEAHLIPNVLKVALGHGDTVRMNGDDYPTADGTCVRDYIHVEDLAAAHLLALRAVAEGTHRVYNLGSGTGFSVREVIEACRQVTGRSIPVTVAPRRPGDPAVLVASSARIRAELGWQPAKTDLPTIIADAWAFAEHTGLPA